VADGDEFGSEAPRAGCRQDAPVLAPALPVLVPLVVVALVVALAVGLLVVVAVGTGLLVVVAVGTGLLVELVVALLAMAAPGFMDSMYPFQVSPDAVSWSASVWVLTG
jgi:hypothetical protein